VINFAVWLKNRPRPAYSSTRVLGNYVMPFRASFVEQSLTWQEYSTSGGYGTVAHLGPQ
jgi:hypothetical protein